MTLIQVVIRLHTIDCMLAYQSFDCIDIAFDKLPKDKLQSCFFMFTRLFGWENTTIKQFIYSTRIILTIVVELSPFHGEIGRQSGLGCP